MMSTHTAEIRDTSQSPVFPSLLSHRCSPLRDVKIATFLMLRLGSSHLLNSWLLGNLREGITGLSLSGDLCKFRKPVLRMTSIYHRHHVFWWEQRKRAKESNERNYLPLGGDFRHGNCSYCDQLLHPNSTQPSPCWELICCTVCFKEVLHVGRKC